MDSLPVLADLRILATSDVHMHLTGWDALRDCAVPGAGMDTLATVIGRARDTAPGACVLVDNGDVLQGAPMGDVCAMQDPDGQHPWPVILNAMGYDAVGLGNHDFDFGLPFLERVIAQIDAPTLCASLTGEGRIAGVSETTLLHRQVTCTDGEVRDVAVGVTAVLPPQTAIWNHRYLAGRLSFAPGIAATRRAVTALRAQGADIVLVLCHSGLSVSGTADDENFAAEIAHHVNGVDALVMGHTHQRFPNENGPHHVYGVPAVMPGFRADVLGQIDLQLAWTVRGWHVAAHDAALHTPKPEDTAHPQITELAAPAIERTRAVLNQTVSRTERGFHNYFGMLQSGPTGTLVAQAMMRSVAEHVAGSDLAELPLLAAVAPMALGGRAGPRNYINVPRGPVRARHLAMMVPYPNAVWALVLRGADLYRWAERAAAFFAPGSDENGKLVDPNAPPFNFDALHGLEATIDPWAPAIYDPLGHMINPDGGRVHSLAHGGNQIEQDQKFLLAVTSYRGAGGGSFPGLDGDPQVVRTEVDLMAALCNSLRSEPSHIDPRASVWRFASRSGARATIETSPLATAHLDDIAAFDPQVIGETPDGFLKLSVAF